MRRNRLKLPSLAVPAALAGGPQPHLFAEWYSRNRVRRWMEYEHRAGFVIGLVEPRPGRMILDIGCDWGFACMTIAGTGARAWGVDIDRSSIEFGRRLAAANGISVDLQYANARALPFPDASFDAIVAIETIEHVPVAERAQVFREISRVLKPGGVAAISTPNPNGIAELAKRIFGRSRLLRRHFYGGYHDEMRLRTFPSGDIMVDILLNRHELQEHVAGTGLRILKHHRIVFVNKFLPPWLLGPAKVCEALFEHLPLIRRLGSTSVYLLENRSGSSP
jgi:2-polyprenyl-3-methyl-5-hydroxy-6-metoxy-1,4-benzoquinol methylase